MAVPWVTAGQPDEQAGRRRKWWGWGYEDGDLTPGERDQIVAPLAAHFGRELTPVVPPPVSGLALATPRVKVPAALADITRSDPWTRASHSFGKAYRDVVRALKGELRHPPDHVVFPRDEQEVAAVLDWCTQVNAAAIPYGGGSSVVGGVEPDVGDGYAAAVTIDMSAAGRVLEVEPVSRAARIQAGALGPAIEGQLRAAGGNLTLRHFPQSFEVSTIGGWVATRSGGHFATRLTHIDDVVEGLRVVTPSGVVATRRLPATGAGPSPDRLFLGSEGALGIVTEVWVRLHERPTFQTAEAVLFPTFSSAVVAARGIAQADLFPSNCRLLDPMEALISGVGDGSAAILLVGFESADHPVAPWCDRAVEICADHGGVARLSPGGGGDGQEDGDETRRWRSAFLRAPYVRDALVTAGILCETFETAVTWDRLDALDEAVRAAVAGVLDPVAFGAAVVSCRLTHVYPDGAAPYYTVLAPARPGSEVAVWDDVKAAASEAILAAGGTITHHHAVGRVHSPWYDRQVPRLFRQSLADVKQVLDPGWILNPGVLVRRSG